VDAVVGLLTVDLRGDAGELRVVRDAERVEPDRVRSLVEPVPRDRPCPLQPAQLDEGGGAVVLGRAVEGERVGVGAELARGELVQRSRMADLVLRDRREGDVLLERRRDPRPLRVPPAEQQLVIRDAEQEIDPVAQLASALRAEAN